MHPRMKIVYALILVSAGLKGAVCGQGKADPLSGTSRLVLENERVRVSEVTVAPQGRVPKPAWPSVEIVDQSGPGAKSAWEKLQYKWTEPAKSPASAPKGWHAVRIEIKDADCPLGPAILPPTDITKLADPGFTTELENSHMRVLHGKLPAGEKEPWHTHTWPAVVCYFGLPKSQRIEADGTIKPRAAFTELQVNWDMGATTRLTPSENLGTTLYQAYRTELKPVVNTH